MSKRRMSYQTPRGFVKLVMVRLKNQAPFFNVNSNLKKSNFTNMSLEEAIKEYRKIVTVLNRPFRKVGKKRAPRKA